MIDDLLSILDVPGALLRNTLAGRNPLQGIATDEERTTGRDLLESWGFLDPNEEGLDWGDVAGFGVDLIADPLNLLGGLGLARGLGRASRTMRAADAASSAPVAARATAVPPASLPRARFPTPAETAARQADLEALDKARRLGDMDQPLTYPPDVALSAARAADNEWAYRVLDPVVRGDVPRGVRRRESLPNLQITARYAGLSDDLARHLDDLPSRTLSPEEAIELSDMAGAAAGVRGDEILKQIGRSAWGTDDTPLRMRTSAKFYPRVPFDEALKATDAFPGAQGEALRYLAGLRGKSRTVGGHMYDPRAIAADIAARREAPELAGLIENLFGGYTAGPNPGGRTGRIVYEEMQRLGPRYAEGVLDYFRPHWLEADRLAEATRLADVGLPPSVPAMAFNPPRARFAPIPNPQVPWRLAALLGGYNAGQLLGSNY